MLRPCAFACALCRMAWSPDPRGIIRLIYYLVLHIFKWWITRDYFESIKKKSIGLRCSIVWLRETVEVEEQCLGRTALLSTILLIDGTTLKKFKDTWFAKDNYNAASKLRRFAEEQLGFKQEPCWSHFRNIWIHRIKDASNIYLTAFLCHSLEKWDPRSKIPCQNTLHCYLVCFR